MNPDTKSQIKSAVLTMGLVGIVITMECNGQIMSPRAAGQQTTAMTSLSAPAPAAPQKSFSLAWSNTDSGVISWRVHTGTARNQWTTNFVVSTPRVAYTSGLFYGVASIGGGQESSMSYWPSNRVVALEVEVTDTLRNQFVGSFTWLTYTNAPGDAASKYLRINERLIRYE